MHHSYLDKYARHDSPLHRLDARTKILMFAAPVILLALVPYPGAALVLSLVLLLTTVIRLAKIPLAYLLKRSLIVIPFTGFAVLSYALTASEGDIIWKAGPFALTGEGIKFAVRLLVRAWLAVSFMIVLINTTPFDRLMSGLNRFKIPSILVMLLSFLYRYLYLLWDEVERMQRARNARYFGGRFGKQLPLLGNLAASLFVRSYERAERVQFAMQARGWNGEAPPAAKQRLAWRDLLVLAAGVILTSILWSIRHL